MWVDSLRKKDCRLPHGLYVQLRYWIGAWQAWIGPTATHSLAMHVGLQRLDARRRNLQCVGLMSTSPHIIFQEKIQNPFD